MCIAIFTPKEKQLSKNIIKNCWRHNSDGAGFMYSKDGILKVHKEMESVKSFYGAYLQAKEEAPESPFVLHFRIATHGKINTINCHPIRVFPNLGFVHNGMLDCELSDRYSDTIIFKNTILKGLPRGFHRNKAILSFIETYIGWDNKLIFMDNRGRVSIVNGEEGIWKDDCWFSNNSFKDSAYGRYFKPQPKYREIVRTIRENETEAFLGSSECFFCKETTPNHTKICDECTETLSGHKTW